MVDLTSASLASADLSPSFDPTALKSEKDTPEGIAKAATQFEALLIGEVLKSAREADGSGWLGDDEDEAASTLMDVSEQQVSQALASRGGLGLAKMISAGLAKASAQSKSHSTKTAETR